MEVDGTDRLPFLDLAVYQRNDGTLTHRVYRKLTHTDLMLVINILHKNGWYSLY